MKWIIDKTYWFCKYNTLKVNKKIMENAYEKDNKEKILKIGELQDEVEYYKEKNKLANKRYKKLKEKLKEEC